MNLEVYLQEIMRNVASALMTPVMIVLVCLILFSVYSVGSIIAEFIIERRHFKANMPRDIKAIKDSSYDELPETIESTGLLRRQKQALQVIAANMGLPEDDLFALAKAEVSATDARYRRKVARTDLVTKIAPMMGLMCTLIPLGPGIVAMGQGEVNLLSNSLLVAFDGTVAGLIGGVVSMVVSSIRKRWYANYLVATESLTTCVLEKAQAARAEGIELPYEGDIRAKADALRSGAAKSERKKRGKRGKAAEQPSASAERAGKQGGERAGGRADERAGGAAATNPAYANALASSSFAASPETSASALSANSAPASALSANSTLTSSSQSGFSPAYGSALGGEASAPSMTSLPSAAYEQPAPAGFGAMGAPAAQAAQPQPAFSGVTGSFPASSGQPQQAQPRTGSFGAPGGQAAYSGAYAQGGFGGQPGAYAGQPASASPFGQQAGAFATEPMREWGQR